MGLKPHGLDVGAIACDEGIIGAFPCVRVFRDPFVVLLAIEEREQITGQATRALKVDRARNEPIKGLCDVFTTKGETCASLLACRAKQSGVLKMVLAGHDLGVLMRLVAVCEYSIDTLTLWGYVQVRDRVYTYATRERRF